MNQARFCTFAGIEQGQRCMTFEEYLVKKRIDKAAFAADDPDRYRAWEDMYAQMHPNSFYIAVKMLLNNVRLRYHLREEDVPKPATTAAPRPAARRAAAPVPNPAAEPPATIPVAPGVPQETTEEKPIIPAAAPKPRPVVRRPAALQTPPAETESAGSPEKTAGETTPPAAPRARPVIKRPVIAKPAAEAAPDKPAESNVPAPQALVTDAPTEAAKPARPRPVIKRPAALQKPPQEGEKPTEAPTTGIEPTSEATATEMPVPPRPVIKRPTALQTPAEEPASPAAGDKAAAAGLPHEPVSTESPAQPAAEDTPKPPRPRPVIKRPAALTKTAVSENEADAAKPADETQITSPASGGDPQANKTVPEGNADAPQPARPPRPRPVIRRPTPPAPAPEQARNEVSETESGPESEPEQATKAASAAGVASTNKPAIPEEEQAPGPKPPRPRPIMRRPPPKAEE